VTDLALGVRAAAAGLGIVRAPLPMVLGYLKEEQLVDVLREWTPPGVAVQAVLPPGVRSSPRPVRSWTRSRRRLHATPASSPRDAGDGEAQRLDSGKGQIEADDAAVG
jgi:DNA-binding transcriptional LysR family regulator